MSTSLSHDALREAFKRQGFVQVPEVMPRENAERVHKIMLERTSWNLVFANEGKHIDLPGSQLTSMPAGKVKQLQHAIYAQAREGFQYCYNNYPIYDALKAGMDEGHPLHAFYRWINGEDLLGFARAITGFDDIAFADAQATRYMPGHFLTTHDDSQEGKNRRAAYIFNFTPRWSEDWGGYLQLLDESGDVRRGLKPTFNALNILAVPQRHNVGIVAPFAAGMRLSISGWFRYGDDR
ncbi:MAG TPA: 2OG-Fe(II) oxygenase family protein [Woeseiaceae bacterium]|nr:2OG-Fe(II) oxygenase family protein [Woeseiaceae bacterium]